MTTFYTETFPSAGPAFGGDQPWTEITGDWANAGSNTATVNFGGDVAWARCDTTTPSADMAATVTLDACPPGRSAGVAVRMTNTGTLLVSQSFYAADFHFDTGTCYILLCVSGSVSTLTSISFTVPSFPCDIALSVYGTALGAYLNGTSIWSGTDSSVTAGSKAGLDSYNSSGDVVFATVTAATAFQASASFSGTDSATLAETATVSLLTSDAVTFAESTAVTASFTDSDSAQVFSSGGGYGAGGYGEGGYGDTGIPTLIGVAPATPDAASVSEAAAFTAALTATDLAGLSDAASVAASVSSTDTASGAASEALAVATTSTDAATFGDASSAAIGLSGVLDSGQFAEQAPAVSLTGPADGATGVDVALIAATVAGSDGATAGDSGGVGTLGLTSTDTVAFAELAAVTASVAGLDAMAVGDVGSVSASVADSDSATAAETADTAVVKTGSDSATFADAPTSLTASVADVDAIAAAEAAPLISLARADSATFAEVTVLAPAVSGAEAVVLSEGVPSVAVADSDSAQVVDSWALTHLLVDADGFTSSDAAALAPSVFGSDGAVSTEAVSTLTATVAGVDAAALVDLAAIAATLTVADSGGAAETALIGLSGTDGAVLAEATPAITVAVSDLHVAIDSLASLTASVAGADQVLAVMTGDSGMPAAIQVAGPSDSAGLGDMVGPLSATVVGLDAVGAFEQAPNISLSSADTAASTDATSLGVAARDADGVAVAELPPSMTAAATAADRLTVADRAHVDATVNGGLDLLAFDDSDALGRVITAILSGIDDTAGLSDGDEGYGQDGYGDEPYGGEPGGAVLTGAPMPAVTTLGGDMPALILTGTPTL